MATITNARLEITRDRSRKTVRPKVTATIRFTELERNFMKLGLNYSLRCELMGDDAGPFNGDDRLYRYRGSRRFPDGTPSGSEEITFVETIASDVLDEDDSIFNRGDEVYGHLILTSDFALFGASTITRNTNVIEGRF